MPTYMLLLRSDRNDFKQMSPEEIQGVIQRYKKWRESLIARGYHHDGQKLRDESGRVMTHSGGKLVVTDGPYVETREILGGYFAFDADSYEQAIEIASDCPHLHFGSVEVREIEPVHLN